MSDNIKTGIQLWLKDNFSEGIKKAGSEVQNFASGAAAAIQGVDKAFSGVKTAIGALGVSLSLGAATKQIIALDDDMNAIGMQAGISAEEVNKLKQAMYDVATSADVKLPMEQLRAAGNALIAQTGDYQFVIENMRNIGLAIRATGAAGSDIGMLYAVFNTMGLSAEETAEAFGTLVEQGKASGFVMKDMAAIGPRLIAQYRAFGRDGVGGVKEAGAALEYIYKGIQNADITGTAFSALLSSFQDVNVQQKMKVGLGVDVFGDDGKMKSVTNLIKETVEAAKGDANILSQLFNQQSMKALNTAIAEYNKNLEETGVGAVTGIQEFLEMTGDANSVQADAAKRAETLAANLTNLQNSFYRFADSRLTKPLKWLTDVLDYLAQDPERFNRVFKVIAGGVGLIAASKGLASVMKLFSAFKNFKGGGNINIGTNAGGNGMPVYVTNWGGKAGASPFPSTGAASGNQISTTKTPTGKAAGTPLGQSKIPKGMMGRAAGAGALSAALVAVPQMFNEIRDINANEDMTKKEKNIARGGAVGEAVGKIGGAAAGAAAGAAIGSVIPGIGTLIGAAAGGLIGYFGGRGGRLLGEKIGEAVSGDDEKSEKIGNQLPSDVIPMENLPYEITSQYMTDEPKYTGQTTANLEGEVAMKVDIDITNRNPTVSAEFIRNTTGGRVMPELGSAPRARELL